MRDDLAIEPARAADIDAIHGLETAAFPSPWRREFFESELHSSGRLNLVARRGEALVGYVFAMYFFDEMHINKIAVSESERRQGVALALMDACDEFATKSGIKSISLEVRESNEGAQAFYRRLGFAALYVRPKYYPDGEAAVVMMREVS
jgi:ribosomal-protein-alanine N-acetyltransferase